MVYEKIAFVSDIHGNSAALKEVLNDINNKDIDVVVNLGDSIYGPLDPVGTFELLEENNVVSISGNQDRMILENLEQPSGIETLEYVKSCLNPKMIEWLDNLPFDLVIQDTVYCCHGTPSNDSEYLLENPEKDHVAIKDQNNIDDLLKGIKQRIVVCGHSHITNVVETGNKLVINPGSIGLPAYDDDLPVYHKMQNYNPRACYSLINILGNTTSVERVSINYNFEKSAKLAEKNNRSDWAKWIRTGIV